MIAIIDNKPMNVKVIDAEYDVNKLEVEIISGTFAGARCIVDKSEIREEVTNATKSVRIMKEGIHFGKTGHNVKLLKTGRVEAWVWSDRAEARVLKRFEAHEVSAITE